MTETKWQKKIMTENNQGLQHRGGRGWKQALLAKVMMKMKSLLIKY